ncbi:nucleotidyl transferase AbiEii/AbiGii toxin family protein [Aquiflexum sp.]|uniref:nucleotidyl transferase AbiEii/AbiGii toxin family protein n=1 Tax=Aquiflexum sp. TaxID=1872584 RepID=UPI0035934551
MIKQWIELYKPKNKEELNQSMREVMQEITLAGLYRASFYEKAAFYGGTALRIFHGLDRFSEDLDFTLLDIYPDFSLSKYLNSIENEFSSLGLQVSIKEKEKSKSTQIESAFLKSETVWKELILENTIPGIWVDQKPNIKVKIEVDTRPPMGFSTEEKLLLKPFSFYVKCLSIQDLFAGKMHALLFRKWNQNVKGRDWYDFEWYVKKGIPINLNHFILRALDSEDLKAAELSKEEFKILLHQRIEDVDLQIAKADILRFIKNPLVIKIWSKNYFHDLVNHIQFS